MQRPTPPPSPIVPRRRGRPRPGIVAWTLASALALIGAAWPVTGDAAPGHAATMATALEGHLNLNTATAEQLDLLPGIGPTTAGKIVAYRRDHAFRSVRQLMRIKGIGPKTYARVRPYVRIDGVSTLRVVPTG